MICKSQIEQQEKIITIHKRQGYITLDDNNREISYWGKNEKKNWGQDLKPNYETIGITNSLIKHHLLLLTSNKVEHA